METIPLLHPFLPMHISLNLISEEEVSINSILSRTQTGQQHFLLVSHFLHFLTQVVWDPKLLGTTMRTLRTLEDWKYSGEKCLKNARN
jgi:hypothetical protein